MSISARLLWPLSLATLAPSPTQSLIEPVLMRVLLEMKNLEVPV